MCMPRRDYWTCLWKFHLLQTYNSYFLYDINSSVSDDWIPLGKGSVNISPYLCQDCSCKGPVTDWSMQPQNSQRIPMRKMVKYNKEHIPWNREIRLIIPFIGTQLMLHQVLPIHHPFVLRIDIRIIIFTLNINPVRIGVFTSSVKLLFGFKISHRI